MSWSLAVPVCAWILVGADLSPGAAALSGHGLYVPPGVAPSLDRVRDHGIHDLVYETDEFYPAARFIGLLQDALRRSGWSVPTIDPLNPDLGPSLVKLNWARWQDTGRPSPVEHVYIRDWQCE